MKQLVGDFPDEVWAILPELPETLAGEYLISNYGRIKRIKTGRVLKPYLGGKCAKIVINNTKGLLVHNIVAKVFIPNPEGKENVVHLDGDRFNNHIDNLEWMDRAELNAFIVNGYKNKTIRKRNYGSKSSTSV